MKILVVHNRYRSSSPSGENRVVDQEHAALVAAGHEVQRFERLSDDIAQLPLHRKALVPVEVVWNPKSARDISEVLETFKPDVVHLHNLFPMLSPSVLQSCQRHRVPCIATIHNYRQICAGGSLFRTGSACRVCVGRRLPTPGVRHGCYRGSSVATLPISVGSITQRRIWQSAPSAFVFLSDAQRRELESMEFPLERCFVKPNFVLPVPPKDTTDDVVVYFGRLTEAKGVRVLMRAWDQYMAACPESGLRLAIAGAGPLDEEVGDWARARPSVEALGLLGREECVALVRRARAVVAPSEWPEPFGLVVAEAMAAGVAPIATSHGSFVDMITDRVDGLLYPPGDAGALARLLREVEDHPARMDQLGAAAKQTFERRFHPSNNIAQLEAIYQFAIDHPRWLDAAGSTVVASSGPGPAPADRSATGPSGPASYGNGASEAMIADFWQSHPCGDGMVGGLPERYRLDYEKFFADYDRHRYAMESHIPACLDQLDLDGARVLEIGLGQGSESEQLIRRGARWTGLDLTEESVHRVRTRLELRTLPFEDVLQGSVTAIPSPDRTFDMVFSHGVLHHVPDILAAEAEIHRVLRPGGRLVVMLYARHSLNYWFSIALLRRLALLTVSPLGHRPSGMLGDHLENARREGLTNYLRMERFTHANTDGPKNPYARVYDRSRVRRDFPHFSVVRSRKWFMHAPPLPVHGLPGSRLLGWHLWVELQRKGEASVRPPGPAMTDAPPPKDVGIPRASRYQAAS